VGLGDDMLLDPSLNRGLGSHGLSRE
jgi:hypothetical protein